MRRLAVLFFCIYMLFTSILNRVASDDITDSQIDTIPPVVIISDTYKISKPVNGKSTIILTGIVMDNIGVSSVIWQSFGSSKNKLVSDSGIINYSESPLANHSAPGNCKWTSKPIPLFAGDNLVTIAASDKQNNIGMQSLHVLLQTIDGKLAASITKVLPDRIKGTVFYVPSIPYTKVSG